MNINWGSALECAHLAALWWGAALELIRRAQARDGDGSLNRNVNKGRVWCVGKDSQDEVDDECCPDGCTGIYAAGADPNLGEQVSGASKGDARRRWTGQNLNKCGWDEQAGLQRA